MQERPGNRGKTSSPPRRRGESNKTIPLLVLSFSILLVAGLASVAYCAPLNPVVTNISFAPIPAPQLAAWYANRSLAAGGTREFKVTINYSTGLEHTAVLVDELRLVFHPLENGLDHWEICYVYFGFFSNESGRVYPAGYTLSEAINETIYDPTGNVLKAGAASATLTFATAGGVATPFVTLVSFAEARDEGAYVVRVANVGQSILNGTFVLGFSTVEWSRPFFTMGVMFLVFSGAVGIGTVVLFVLPRRRAAY